jgi:telomere length regulation protein
LLEGLFVFIIRWLHFVASPGQSWFLESPNRKTQWEGQQLWVGRVEQMEQPLKLVETSSGISGSITSAGRKTNPACQSQTQETGSLQIQSPDDALDALKNQPSYETLTAVLRSVSPGNGDWDIRGPGSQSSQIVSVLVSEIAPNYWSILKEDADPLGDGHSRVQKSPTMAHFVDCIRSTTGINAILRALEVHVAEARKGRAVGQDPSPGIRTYLELLSAVLDGEDSIFGIWLGTTAAVKETVKRKILRQETTNLLGGGKIIARAAEAQMALQKAEHEKQEFWIADGKQYSQWLCRNVIRWTKKEVRPDEDVDICTALLTKAFRLGYTGQLQLR